ncbi:MAG: helix-turn-helix protein [Bacteroidota bacterium]|nr:helix-turn-helix protein [Bacteroidota bacterium]
MIAGECIKFWREARNYTEEYMASELGISQPAYSKLEKGQIKIDAERLFRISLILNVSLDELSPHADNLTNHINGKPNAVDDSYYNKKSQLASSERELYEKLISEKEKLISEKQETIVILKNILTFFQRGKKERASTNRNTNFQL